MKRLIEVASSFCFTPWGKQIMTSFGLGRYISKQIPKEGEGVVVYMSKKEFEKYEQRMRVKEIEKKLQ